MGHLVFWPPILTFLRTIVLCCSCTVVLFNPRRNNQAHVLNASRKTVTSLALAGDGKLLATGECGHMPNVRVWDISDPYNAVQIAEFSGHKYGINCVVSNVFFFFLELLPAIRSSRSSKTVLALVYLSLQRRTSLSRSRGCFPEGKVTRIEIQAANEFRFISNIECEGKMSGCNNNYNFYNAVISVCHLTCHYGIVKTAV